MHHGGEGTPDFNIKTVKTYKDSLSRQVGEAVRIELRGNVLNSQSVFNRCRLTRLVVDKSWMTDRQKALEEERSKNKAVAVLEEEGEDTLIRETEAGTKRTTSWDSKRPPKKRRRALKEKLEEEDWGEMPIEDNNASTAKDRDNFLRSGPAGSGLGTQAKMKVYTGKEWLARQVINDVIGRAWFDILWLEEEAKRKEAERTKTLAHEDFIDWSNKQLSHEDFGDDLGFWDVITREEDAFSKRKHMAKKTGTMMDWLVSRPARSTDLEEEHEWLGKSVPDLENEYWRE